jgi:hypothetical protein
MRRVIVLLTVAAVMGLSGCGGGGSDSSGTQTAITMPGISNLSGSKSTATLNEGSGAVTVTFTANFVDAGGDIASMTIESYDATTGAQSMTKTIPISGVTGQTSGTIAGALVVGTTTRGSWNVKIYVTDTSGNKSNTLNTTWAIL